MNVVSRPLKMSLEQFLAWEREQEGSHEFDADGTVVPINGGTKGHYKLAYNLARHLEAVIDASRWEVVHGGLKLQIGNLIRYPDLMVAPVSADPLSELVTDPVLVVEVLSPTSIRRDSVIKTRDYHQCASVQHYLMLRQDRREAVVFDRLSDGWRETVVTDRTLSLAALGVSIQLEDIYRGIVAP